MALLCIDEDTELVECKGCGGQMFWNYALFDDRHENFFCDEDCFKEWAIDNVQLIAEFYQKMNVY